MKHYAIAEFDVSDPRWVADYVANVTPMIERHGGRYLARTSKIEKLEGERRPPQIVVLVEWPSREAALAFFESDEYRPYRRARQGGSAGELALVPGEDVTGAARIAG